MKTQQHTWVNTERWCYADFYWHILEGWPESQERGPDSNKEFYSFPYELFAIDGLVLKGTNSIIVPEKLRQNALNKPHLGTSKMIVRARTCVFWPGLNGDIKQLCKSCEVCSKFSAKQPSESLRNDLVCTKLWDTLAWNLFEFHGKLFAIIVDRYSTICMCRVCGGSYCRQKNSGIIKHLVQFGMPNKIWCDRQLFYPEVFTIFVPI